MDVFVSVNGVKGGIAAEQVGTVYIAQCQTSKQVYFHQTEPDLIIILQLKFLLQENDLVCGNLGLYKFRGLIT